MLQERGQTNPDAQVPPEVVPAVAGTALGRPLHLAGKAESVVLCHKIHFSPPRGPLVALGCPGLCSNILTQMVLLQIDPLES